MGVNTDDKEIGPGLTVTDGVEVSKMYFFMLRHFRRFTHLSPLKFFKQLDLLFSLGVLLVYINQMNKLFINVTLKN